MSRVKVQIPLLLLIHCTYTYAQAVRRRYAHAAVVADTWLYFDGGDVSYQNGVWQPETTTYGIDLSKDWSNTSLDLVQTPRPAGSLALNYQRFWWSSTRNAAFCFGGEVTSAFGVSDTTALSRVPPESVWQFAPSGDGSGAWSEAVGPTGDAPYPASALRAANGAATSDGEHGYYIGGYNGQLTTKTFHNYPWPSYRQAGGLQTFDFGSLNLTNSSDGGYFASQYYNESFYYDPGCMLYTPLFGVEGLLILLGGGGQSGPFVHEWLPNQGNFDNITIYDIHTQTWLSQRATGTIPNPRAKFCAVGAASGDNSTFDIFIYGGILNNVLGPDNSAADQVYILSLPSFRWFQADYPSQYPRAQHSCSIAGGNQMIVVGGLDPSEVPAGDPGLWEAFNGTADPWNQTIGVFDMTLLKWKDGFTSAAAPYTSPDLIKQSVNGINGTRFPSSWSSSAVKALFENSTSTTSLGNPPVPSATTTAPPPSKSGLSSKTIIGIVVGCILAVLLVAIGIWYLLVRKRGLPAQAPKATELNDMQDKKLHIGFKELSGDDGSAQLHDGRSWHEMDVPKQPVELATEVRSP